MPSAPRVPPLTPPEETESEEGSGEQPLAGAMGEGGEPVQGATPEPVAVLVAMVAGFALTAALFAVGLKTLYSKHTYWGGASEYAVRGRRYRRQWVTSFESRFWRRDVQPPRISDISRRCTSQDEVFGMDEQHGLTDLQATCAEDGVECCSSKHSAPAAWY